MSAAFRDMSNILPGQQDTTGNGDPFSLDWWEQQSLDENKIMQEHAIEKKFFEVDGAISFDSPEQIAARADRIVPAARQKQGLRVENIAGTVGTASVPIRVPSDCKLIRAHCNQAICVVSSSSRAAYSALALDAAQNDFTIASFSVGMPCWIPVRQQLGTIYVAATQATTQVQLMFYCGDVDMEGYIL